MERPDPADLRVAYRRYLSAIVAFHLAAADHVGLGATDYEALNLLEIEAPITAGDLGHLLGLSTSATTRLIDRLEGLGLARRVPDDSDHRRVLVQATSRRPDGLDEALAHVLPGVGDAIGTLDAHQLAGLAAYVDAAGEAYRDATHRLRQPLAPPG
jgi:DNA-binding MarR family transcriptional regulator